jgi:hypothetical protein
MLTDRRMGDTFPDYQVTLSTLDKMAMNVYRKSSKYYVFWVCFCIIALDIQHV